MGQDHAGGDGRHQQEGEAQFARLERSFHKYIETLRRNYTGGIHSFFSLHSIGSSHPESNAPPHYPPPVFIASGPHIPQMCGVNCLSVPVGQCCGRRPFPFSPPSLQPGIPQPNRLVIITHRTVGSGVACRAVVPGKGEALRKDEDEEGARPVAA